MSSARRYRRAAGRPVGYHLSWYCQTKPAVAAAYALALLVTGTPLHEIFREMPPFVGAML
jgi:hypothetical protein